ncbi:hypothetical protein EVAR_14551_1 [Eumeta japonica]|uniref:Uncharacterized protein n=1 Tax=Eumeta variegata TaxID=151549 RepID=A0A4C1U369_EUMVA|nr:hypothetical protein EVAR_14551_1 [Eumeta japonica]
MRTPLKSFSEKELQQEERDQGLIPVRRGGCKKCIPHTLAPVRVDSVGLKPTKKVPLKVRLGSVLYGGCFTTFEAFKTHSSLSGMCGRVVVAKDDFAARKLLLNFLKYPGQAPKRYANTELNASDTRTESGPVESFYLRNVTYCVRILTTGE